MRLKYLETSRDKRRIARLEQKIQSLEKARDQIKASAKGKGHGKVSRIFNFRIFGWKITFVRHRHSEWARETGTLIEAISRFNPSTRNGRTAKSDQTTLSHGAGHSAPRTQSNQTAQSGQTTN